MELKEYPCVHVEKLSDGNGNQACCTIQLSCFIPGIRRKDINRTTIEGLDDDLVLENILVDLMKECKCKGKIVSDRKLGKMVQLEGNQESQVKEFLRLQGLTKA